MYAVVFKNCHSTPELRIIQVQPGREYTIEEDLIITIDDDSEYLEWHFGEHDRTESGAVELANNSAIRDEDVITEGFYMSFFGSYPQASRWGEHLMCKFGTFELLEEDGQSGGLFCLHAAK